MKIRTAWWVVFAALCAAQDGPDPREIPVPRIKTAMGTLPGVKELPVRQELPDVLVMNDGKKITPSIRFISSRRLSH